MIRCLWAVQSSQTDGHLNFLIKFRLHKVGTVCGRMTKTTRVNILTSGGRAKEGRSWLEQSDLSEIN